MAIPRKSRTSPSPAPAKVNSTTASSASSGGGSAQKGKSIPNWIMPIGIAYLMIRGLFIIGSNYIATFDWVIIAILFLLAIISFWNGKNRWLSLILIVAAGCIIWFNQAHIDSSNQNSTEQSAGQEQVATAPATVEEEEISKEPILPKSNNPILLTKSGYYNTIKGKYRLCFSWLGDEEDGGSRINQSIKINDVEFNSRGSNCYPYKSEGKIYVEFINPTQTPNDSYSYYKKRVGGQGIYPFLELVK